MRTLFSILLISVFTFQAGNADDGISLSEFKKLHKEIVPQKEVWNTIPWQTDLVEAQRIAVKQKKLIFIWAMDGHPLGCT